MGSNEAKVENVGKQNLDRKLSLSHHRQHYILGVENIA